MRILQVVSYYPPERAGGVGEVAAHLHRGLLEAGHESEVLTTGSAAAEPPVHRAGRSPTWFALTSLRHARGLSTYDVIHIHHGEAFGLIVAARLRRNRPRILLTMHVSNWEIRKSLSPFKVGERVFRPKGIDALASRWIKAPTKAVLDNLVMRLVDEVSFVSQAGAIDVLGRAAGKNARIIHNGIPQLPDSLGQGSPDWVEMLYVGRPGLGKRVELLPLILREVRMRIPDARLRIVGFTADSKPDLARSFADLGLNSAVSFIGPVRSDQLRPFYESAGVLVVPSAYEGLPMVILEAMRSGPPCVATKVGGIPEAIADGRSGFLVEPDDPSAMAERVVRILEDAQLGAAMKTAAAKTFSDRFALSRQVDEYLALYESLLEWR